MGNKYCRRHHLNPFLEILIFKISNLKTNVMKEKVSEDIFETECWSYDVISDPYQVFAETFSTASMDFLRRFIKKILHYAESQLAQVSGPVPVRY